jgi:aspartate dehydrogenase
MDKNSRKTRIGVIGYGYIGRHLCQAVTDNPAWNLELAFVHNRDPQRLGDVPEGLRLSDLSQAQERSADLIVECAHPDISRHFGAAFLAHADYLPLSTNALGDEAVEQSLLQAAARSGHRLLIPHGALIGLDNLVECQSMWAEVTITFYKHPNNIDFADSGIDPATIRAKTIVYDGPVRGITKLFPRNVNTMATCALATTGLDRCRGVLVADPSLDVAIAEVHAKGHDGSLHHSRKVQPVVGVSGTEMLASQIASVRRAANVQLPGLNFV